MAEEQPVLAAASAKVPLVRNPEGIITTDGFLDVCRLVLPVVGESGGCAHRCRACALADMCRAWRAGLEA